MCFFSYLRHWNQLVRYFWKSPDSRLTIFLRNISQVIHKLLSLMSPGGFIFSGCIYFSETGMPMPKSQICFQDPIARQRRSGFFEMCTCGYSNLYVSIIINSYTGWTYRGVHKHFVWKMVNLKIPQAHYLIKPCEVLQCLPRTCPKWFGYMPGSFHSNFWLLACSRLWHIEKMQVCTWPGPLRREEEHICETEQHNTVGNVRQEVRKLQRPCRGERRGLAGWDRLRFRWAALVLWDSGTPGARGLQHDEALCVLQASKMHGGMKQCGGRSCEMWGLRAVHGVLDMPQIEAGGPRGPSARDPLSSHSKWFHYNWYQSILN